MNNLQSYCNAVIVMHIVHVWNLHTRFSYIIHHMFITRFEQGKHKTNSPQCMMCGANDTSALGVNTISADNSSDEELIGAAQGV